MKEGEASKLVLKLSFGSLGFGLENR